MAFVTGEARFTDDVLLPGALWLAFVRSPHAHARLGEIDAADALRLPGVHAVFTAADIGELRPLKCYCGVISQDGLRHRAADWTILAADRVRYVGDPVACVVAATQVQAEAAAAAVRVGYVPLTPFISAFSPVTQPIWPDVPDNVCFDCVTGNEAETDRLFSHASHVARLRLRYPRAVVAPLETRAATASYDRDSGTFRLLVTSQGVHWLRRVLSDALGIAPERLRVETPCVGGSFGSKIFAYPEYAMALWASRRLGLGVRWTASRAEAFLSDTQGRDHDVDASLALDAQGRFLALRVDDRTCLGAYLSQYTPFAQAACGPPVQAGGYLIEALHVRTRGYFTNMTPVDAFRGTGRPEATYLLERLIDQAAFETGRDQAALRALNLRPRTTRPVALITGQVIDGGQFLANQDLCLARADRAGFADRRAQSQGRGKLRGFGLANYLEANGSLGVAKLTTGEKPEESVSIGFDAQSRVTVWVGTQSSGQDHATPLARMIAERLGLEEEAITVREGDSAALAVGGGTGGSKSTLTGLTALASALDEVERRARHLCAAQWQVAPDAVEIRHGVLFEEPGCRRLGFRELQRCFPRHFDVTSTASLEAGSFANGCHACEVELDPATGEVRVAAYTAVDDFGTVVSRANVVRQVEGGVIQGLGHALLHAGRYDEMSGRLLTGSLDDYLLPAVADTPPIAWIDNGLPSLTTPLGIKACGEAAISVSPPAIMNAIIDALRAHVGAETLQMPATPDRILDILAAGRSDAATPVSTSTPHAGFAAPERNFPDGATPGLVGRGRDAAA